MNKGWVDILVVGDVNLSSALYASGEGGEILVRSEGEREWQCGRYAYLEQSGYFFHAFLVLKPWELSFQLPRGLLLLLCVICSSSLEGNYFERVKSARFSPKTLKVPYLTLRVY